MHGFGIGDCHSSGSDQATIHGVTVGLVTRGMLARPSQTHMRPHSEEAHSRETESAATPRFREGPHSRISSDQGCQIRDQALPDSFSRSAASCSSLASDPPPDDEVDEDEVDELLRLSDADE